VFPKSFKTSPLLRAWLRRMNELGVRFALRHRWTGWDDAGRLRFARGNEEIALEADATVLALGGASWPRLGSDASWVPLLEARSVMISRVRPANCGFVVQWSDAFRRFEGAPLKRIAIQFGERNVRGEAMVTHDGLEGGAIYALSGALRNAIEREGSAGITIDLRPDVSADALSERLAAPRGKQSLANVLRKAVKLSPVAAGLLRETAGASLSVMSARDLAAFIKSVPLALVGVQPIARAISTAGGVSFDALDERLMLKALPGVFAAGEMLDWEAPTGGYLLQASFATGVAAANGAIAWIRTGSQENSAATNP
jgi:uncharacterized flavoprotein (TIGR03862 family)